MGEPNASQQSEKKKAEELLRLQRLPEARDAYVRLCKLDPADYIAWLNLGSIHGMLGEFDAAETAFRCVLYLRADVPQAYFNLARLCSVSERFDEARSYWQSYLKLQPNDAYAYAQLGNVFHKMRRLEEAERSLSEALKRQPGNADYYNNAGVILQDLGRYDESLTSYRKALQLKPDMEEVYCNLGNLHHERNEDALAEQNYLAALRINSRNAGSHMSLGHHYARRGRVDQALQCFKESIRLAPEYASAHWNLALLLLLLGHYREGWAEFAWRCRSPEARQQFGARHFSKPMWDGSLTEQTVLVYAEQGLGDSLQFCRYLPLVNQRVERVIFEVQPELIPLLQEVHGMCELVPRRGDGVEPGVEYDMQVCLMDLPRLFGTEIDTIPAPPSYIQANALAKARWQQRFDTPDFNVGLVWAGNPNHWRDRQRSLAVTAFEPLANIEGVSYFSLQKGLAANQLLMPPAGMTIIDLSEELDDFATTAAVIANLDLVITVDTAVAHLAGAMGVPVWTLIYSPPDWRWLLEREDSPWYPSMRLFRQQIPGEWGPVIERVATELRNLVAKDRVQSKTC